MVLPATGFGVECDIGSGGGPGSVVVSEKGLDLLAGDIETGDADGGVGGFLGGLGESRAREISAGFRFEDEDDLGAELDEVEPVFGAVEFDQGCGAFEIEAVKFSGGGAAGVDEGTGEFSIREVGGVDEIGGHLVDPDGDRGRDGGGRGGGALGG